ncbi:MAG TPA: sigma-70 family RNA polymerase sigma factor, partial [Polyangiales bacterium]
LLAFLVQRLGNPSDASEVFSMFGEDLWRGLPTFEWRCSVRGYCFAIARTASIRFRKQANERRERRLALDAAPLSQLVESVRERTLAHLRTEVKSQMREIIQRLPEDDRALLSLRIDQNLSFRELAVALEYAGEVPSEELLTRAAARLRKRFQLIKERVRQSAREAGLLGQAQATSSAE